MDNVLNQEDSKAVLAIVGGELDNAQILFNIGASADQKGDFDNALLTVKAVLSGALDNLVAASVVTTANTGEAATPTAV